MLKDTSFVRLLLLISLMDPVHTLRYDVLLTNDFTSPAGLPAVRHHPGRVRLTLPVLLPLLTLQVAPVVVSTR